MKYFYDYDEIWGRDPAECVKELNGMEDSVINTYMTLGPDMYTASRDEMREAIKKKTQEILDKHGCYRNPLGRAEEYLKQHGLTEKYREYCQKQEQGGGE